MVLVGLTQAAVVGQASFGDATDKLNQKLDELNRVQSNEGPLRDQIDRMNTEVDQLIGRESQLRQEQAVVQHDLAQKQAELDQATAQLNAEKAELARVRAKLQEAVAALENLLVQIYESNQPDLTSIVMRSADWSDLLTRTEYMDHIQNYDDAVVNRVRGLRDQITVLVNQLQATHDRIQTARDAVAAKQQQLASQHAQIQQQQSQLVAARNARQGVLEALLKKEHSIEGDLSNIPAPAGRATLASNGDAIPPSNAPLAVRAGSVSFALHGGGFLSSPLDSTGLEVWGTPGGGNWITVFANSGHAWAYIAGLRWDTGGPGGGNGPRWSTTMRTDTSSFIARHPSGY
jgi:peptidoglycan hydrolase CwlO-like protein